MPAFCQKTVRVSYTLMISQNLAIGCWVQGVTRGKLVCLQTWKKESTPDVYIVNFGVWTLETSSSESRRAVELFTADDTMPIQSSSRWSHGGHCWDKWIRTNPCKERLLHWQQVGDGCEDDRSETSDDRNDSRWVQQTVIGQLRGQVDDHSSRLITHIILSAMHRYVRWIWETCIALVNCNK